MKQQISLTCSSHWLLYDSEKNAADTYFATTSDLLINTSWCSINIFQPQKLGWKWSVIGSLTFPGILFWHYQCNGADVQEAVVGKGGVAAMFRKDKCENILQIHCICHQLALACGADNEYWRQIKIYEGFWIDSASIMEFL